jgi:hypothetical protein
MRLRNRGGSAVAHASYRTMLADESRERSSEIKKGSQPQANAAGMAASDDL